MEAPGSVEAETIMRHEWCNGSMRTVGGGVSGSDGLASFSQQEKIVIDIDRVQDTKNRDERSCVLVP